MCAGGFRPEHPGIRCTALYICLESPKLSRISIGTRPGGCDLDCELYPSGRFVAPTGKDPRGSARRIVIGPANPYCMNRHRRLSDIVPTYKHIIPMELEKVRFGIDVQSLGVPR
jgi:hypothetical protein